MSTSSYMPVVTVEIAFDSGWSTPAVDRTWTDVSDYVELAPTIGITMGRSDEVTQPDANTLTLTFDNSDGRFTPGRAASPYYPNVKIGRPIRVTATPVEGEPPSVRFLGYVDEWPVEWAGSEGYSSTTITASSRRARLGMLAALRSVIEEEILADDPVAYYPLGEPAGSSSAADISGLGQPDLSTTGAVSFGAGTGPGTDGLPAAMMSTNLTIPDADSTLRAHSGLRGLGGLAGVRTGMFVAAQDGAHPGIEIVDGNGYGMYVEIRGDGLAQAGIVGPSGSAFLTGSDVLDNGQTHRLDAQVTWGSPHSTLELYVDGVLVGSATAMNVTATAYTGCEVFNYEPTSTVSHFVISGPVTAARMADVWLSGRTGFAGETTGEWVVRAATWAGIPLGESSIEIGFTTIDAIDPTGAAIVDLLHQIATTEDGVVFDAHDGTLTFHTRHHRYNPLSAFTLDVSKQEVGAEFSPKLDRSSLINQVVVANQAGTVTTRMVDQDSVDAYGVAGTSVELIADRPAAVVEHAGWALLRYAEPRSRVPSLSVDLLPLAPTRQSAVLAATIGTFVEVAGLPAQADSASAAYFVEGAVETIGPEFYEISFNVSPAWPHESLFRINASDIDGPDIVAL